jgi:hypothetical protein
MSLASRSAPSGSRGLNRTAEIRTPGRRATPAAVFLWVSGHLRRTRSKSITTIVGPADVLRAYFLCHQCGTGQFPVDVELDIENTEFSPGVRRMQALVGHQEPFEHGRQQMKVLAGLEVTAKSVERAAEAIGADIAQREQVVRL